MARKKYRKRKTIKNYNQKKRGVKGKINLILFLAAFIIGSCLLLQREHRKASSPAIAIENAKELHIPKLTVRRPEYVVTHTGFTVSYNKEWKNPNWTGYELTRSKVKGTEKRKNRFIPDPHIADCTTRDSDFTKSGYDRGHMVPAADMKWSKEAMEESFYLSNVCPQHPELNQKAWQKLEHKVRQWAVADSAIIIICGPIVGNKCRKIGKSGISVPHSFFKVVLSPFKEKPQAIGFVFKNESCTAPLKAYAVTVDSVEALTGLDFFTTLPDEIENVIEASFDSGYWGL